jgi:hypothetical protein
MLTFGKGSATVIDRNLPACDLLSHDAIKPVSPNTREVLRVAPPLAQASAAINYCGAMAEAYTVLNFVATIRSACRVLLSRFGCGRLRSTPDHPDPCPHKLHRSLRCNAQITKLSQSEPGQDNSIQFHDRGEAGVEPLASHALGM